MFEAARKGEFHRVQTIIHRELTLKQSDKVGGEEEHS